MTRSGDLKISLCGLIGGDWSLGIKRFGWIGGFAKFIEEVDYEIGFSKLLFLLKVIILFLGGICIIFWELEGFIITLEFLWCGIFLFPNFGIELLMIELYEIFVDVLVEH